MQNTGADPDTLARWQVEHASLVGTCDALEAALQRERARRAELETKTRLLTRDVATLREALRVACGFAAPGAAAAAGSECAAAVPAGTTVPTEQYVELLRAALAAHRELEEVHRLRAEEPDRPLASLPLSDPQPLPTTWPLLTDDDTGVPATGSRLPSPLRLSASPARDGAAPAQAALTPPPLVRGADAASYPPPPPPFSSLAFTPLRCGSREPSCFTSVSALTPVSASTSAARDEPGEPAAAQPHARFISPALSASPERAEPAAAATEAAVTETSRCLAGGALTEVLRRSAEPAAEQTWLVRNSSITGESYLVEYAFACLPPAEGGCGDGGVTALGDTVVSQAGRFLCRVAPGEVKAVARGRPTPYSVVVRCCGPDSVSRQPTLSAVPRSRQPPAVGEGSPVRGTAADPGTASTAAAPAAECVRLTPATLQEREAQVRENDRLMAEVVQEMRALAAATSGVASGGPQAPRATTTATSVLSASALAAQCAAHAIEYVDADFPPVSSSLALSPGGGCLLSARDGDPTGAAVVQWCSRSAYVPTGQQRRFLSEEALSPCALADGPLRATGVVAGLAALAEASGAICSAFSSTSEADERNGVFTLWLCERGTWTPVVVDAYLPFAATPAAPPTPLGCTNLVNNDVWASLCEKALAKTMGGYGRLRRLRAVDVVARLAGGPIEEWDWWRRRSTEAAAEMEACVADTARGCAVVLLTTRGEVPPQLPDARGQGRPPVRLRPGTTYRVVAVAEAPGGAGAGGCAALVLRNWHHRSVDLPPPTQTADSGLLQPEPLLLPPPPPPLAPAPFALDDVESDREEDGGADGDAKDTNDVDRRAAADASAAPPPVTVLAGGDDDADACVWLDLRAAVVPHFRHCHVAFDCRKFHDVRVPVPFTQVRSPPAVPGMVLRVTVRRRGATPGDGGQQRRLWLGLHQPLHGFRPSATFTPPYPFGLRLTVLAADPRRRQRLRTCGLGQLLAARPLEVLAESYNGELRAAPSVWMFLELDAPEPCDDGAEDDGYAGGSVLYVVPQVCADSIHAAESYDATTTAVVSLLAAQREHFEVALLPAPDELDAAMSHGLLERLQLGSVAPLPCAPRVQINGKWTDTKCW